uniref:PPR-repeat protein-like n=1 Tax=Oryza sativa subsp. japonica TaxID=39947 RepID=Q6H585_ORYSJ|nr:PPR-repeat protein-like [Oryza sativa Japonica Group]BAD26114.1 PPR-repeat protein-like [Oryza sativa Japonica Group]
MVRPQQEMPDVVTAFSPHHSWTRHLRRVISPPPSPDYTPETPPHTPLHTPTPANPPEFLFRGTLAARRGAPPFYMAAGGSGESSTPPPAPSFPDPRRIIKTGHGGGGGGVGGVHGIGCIPAASTASAASLRRQPDVHSVDDSPEASGGVLGGGGSHSCTESMAARWWRLRVAPASHRQRRPRPSCAGARWHHFAPPFPLAGSGGGFNAGARWHHVAPPLSLAGGGGGFNGRLRRPAIGGGRRALAASPRHGVAPRLGWPISLPH